METRIALANEALERAELTHAEQIRLAEYEFHGLDLRTRAQAEAGEKEAEAMRAQALAELPAARKEADRLRRLINTDFTSARNERVKAYKKALDKANELECLGRKFGHCFNRANVCRYRADLLP